MCQYPHPLPLQISALSVMKDAQRLALLKEVGGTKIYEERRRESLKLMAETEGRQLRIQEVVCFFNPSSITSSSH